MAQVYTVTAGTSVVSISTIQTPNTVVLLSSISYPGHIVGIQDVTGSTGITNYPIIVSTTTGLQFYDGTSSILINQPNGQLSVSSRNPTTWQLLNNVGFFNTLSNAYLNELTTENSYIGVLSTTTQAISTLNAVNVNVTNSILLLGDAQINGDISVAGGVDIFSSLTIGSDLILSSALLVGDAVSIPSTLFLEGSLTAGKNVSTTQSLIVGSNLAIQSTFQALGANLPQALSVNTLVVNSMNLGGGLYVSGSISTHSNLFVNSTLNVFGKTNIENGIITQSSLYVTGGDTLLGGDLITRGQNQIIGEAVIVKDVFVPQNLTAYGSVSTLANAYVLQSTIVNESTLVVGSIIITGNVNTQNISVTGDGNFGTMTANVVNVTNDALFASTFQTSKLSIANTLGIGQNMIWSSMPSQGQTILYISSILSTLTTMSIYGDLAIGNNVTNPGIAGNVAVGDSLITSTLFLSSSVSTLNMVTKNNLTVLGNLFVGGEATADVLGTTASLSISTLSSLTIFVRKDGTIPFVETGRLIDSTGLSTLGLTDKLVVGNLPAKPNYQVTVTDDTGVILGSNVDTFGFQSLESHQLLYRFGTSGLVGPNNLIPFPQPFVSTGGVLAGGVKNNSASNASIQYLFDNGYNFSTNLTVYGNVSTNATQGIINALAFNGSNRWVAGGNQPNNLIYSDDGYNWSAAAGTPFTSSVTAITYGDGLWIAGASQSPYLKFSGDGINWSNASNVTLTSVNDIQYATATGGWVAVGSNQTQRGVNTSLFGTTWSQNNNILDFVGKAVLNVPRTPASLSTWYASGTFSNNPNGFSIIGSLTSDQTLSWVELTIFTPTGGKINPFQRLYYNNYFATSEPGLSFLACSYQPFAENLDFLVSRSADAALWTSLRGGDLITQNETNIVGLVATPDILYAYGSNGNIYTLDVVSYNAPNPPWLLRGQIQNLSSLNTIAQGTFDVPYPATFFNFNVPSYFSSILSSPSIVASNIQASSIVATRLFGNAAGLSNFTTSALPNIIGNQNLTLDKVYSQLSVQASTISSISTYTGNSVTVIEEPFPSTLNIWLAAGTNNVNTGNIQLSFDAIDWTPSGAPTFQYFGTGVSGNRNLSNTVYVATGADDNTQRTIQYSSNGSNWSPITFGGFNTLNSNAYKVANTVAYLNFLDLWAVGGDDTGGTSTIFFCGNGQGDPFIPTEWYATTSNFSNTCLQIAAGTGQQLVALGDGLTPDSPFTNKTNVKYYSFLNGYWRDAFTTSTPTVFDTVGFGDLILPNIGGITGFLGFSGNNLYYSQAGIVWAPIDYSSGGPYNKFYGGKATAVHYGGDGRWVAVCSNTNSASNQIYFSVDAGTNWISSLNQSNTPSSSNRFFPEVRSFKSVTYNSVQDTWIAGAQADNKSNTLWYASNSVLPLSWFPTATGFGGFSTSISRLGVGYGSVTAQQSTLIVTGTGSFTGLSPMDPQIQSLHIQDGVTPSTACFLALAGTGGNALLQSIDGINWTTQQTSFYTVGTARTGIAFSYTTSRWVTSGKGFMKSSSNGTAWQDGNFQFSGTGGAGLAFGKDGSGNNLWVATGEGQNGVTSNIIYSADGISWSQALSNDFTNQSGRDVAYSDVSGLWVAVGYDPIDGSIKNSGDGSNWSNGLLGTPFTVMNAVAYGGGVWAAVGNGTFKISHDGLNWSNPTVSNVNIATYLWGDVAYNGSNLWAAVANAANTAIFISADGSNWSNAYTSAAFTINCIAYNQDLQIWAAGATSPYALYSYDGLNWNSVTVPGYTDGILSIAPGNLIDPTITQGTTTQVLSFSNAQNVFLTSVRGIGYSPYEDYGFVAVGDGITPSKTIGRFSTIQGPTTTFTNVLPAITGGFRSTGYGVTYYISSTYSNWIAVGDAEFSTNTIQYSPDGANWFGTNNASGLRGGGRGVTVGLSTLSSTVVAVGRDILGRGRIVLSKDGFNWTSSLTSTFTTSSLLSLNGYGTGVTTGYYYNSNSESIPNFVAVGKSDFIDRTILTSVDGSNWSSIQGWSTISDGGFNIQGNAVAYAQDLSGNHTFLAVGQDTRSEYRIQYTSSINALSSIWAPVGLSSYSAFTPYGVTYWGQPYNRWVVVGEDSAANQTSTIFFSADPVNQPWQAYDGITGFPSLINVGSANSVYTQQLNQNFRTPILDMQNLVMFARADPVIYPVPTIRLQSTSITFQETMVVNLSTQVVIGSNQPYQDFALTVEGYVYTSSFTYLPGSNVNIQGNVLASNVVVSSMYNKYYTVTSEVTTPYLTIATQDVTSVFNTPNSINFLSVSNVIVQNMNDTIYNTSYGRTGINIQEPYYQLDVSGASVFSTMLTRNLIGAVVEASTILNPSITSGNFSIGFNTTLSSINTIYTQPSSITFNNVLSVDISTQRVGIYTNTPQFDLDVQTAAYALGLQASEVQLDTFYLTLYPV